MMRRIEQQPTLRSWMSPRCQMMRTLVAQACLRLWRFIITLQARQQHQAVRGCPCRRLWQVWYRAAATRRTPAAGCYQLQCATVVCAIVVPGLQPLVCSTVGQGFWQVWWRQPHAYRLHFGTCLLRGGSRRKRLPQITCSGRLLCLAHLPCGILWSTTPSLLRAASSSM